MMIMYFVYTSHCRIVRHSGSPPLADPVVTTDVDCFPLERNLSTFDIDRGFCGATEDVEVGTADVLSTGELFETHFGFSAISEPELVISICDADSDIRIRNST